MTGSFSPQKLRTDKVEYLAGRGTLESLLYQGVSQGTREFEPEHAGKMEPALTVSSLPRALTSALITVAS